MKRKKSILSVLTALVMLAALVAVPVKTALADEPSEKTFADTAALKEMDAETGVKISFGGHTWYPAGWDGSTGGLVLMCDPKDDFGKVQYDSTEPYTSNYEDSDLRAAILAALAGFTDAEKDLMLVTEAAELPPGGDKLYAAYGIFGAQEFLLGADDIPVSLTSGPYSDEINFWLRKSDGDTFALQAASLVHDVYKQLSEYLGVVLPAFCLDTEAILFASAAEGGKADASLTDGVLTLRAEASVSQIGSVARCDSKLVHVDKGTDEGDLYLYVQGNDGTADWVWSAKVTESGDLSVPGHSDLSDCKIWLETVIDGVSYAKMAEEAPAPEEELPVVNGAKLHADGTESDGSGGYQLKTDVLEPVFESASVPVTISTTSLYKEQELSNVLTEAPVPGTPAYFVIQMTGYDDGAPPTLEWAENDVVKSTSDLKAENAEIEIVEISHSPAGGSMSIICKYTEDEAEPVKYEISVDNYDLTLDKKWSGGKVSLTTDEGTNGLQDAGYGFTATEDSEVSVKAVPNEGYEFVEWRKGSKDGAAVSAEADYTFTASEDLDLVAVFQKAVVKYTITFDLNGGTMLGKVGIVNVSFEEGKTITLPEPEKEGYTFDYWEGSKYKAGESYQVTGDHTFKAQWKEAGGTGKKDNGGKNTPGADTGDENSPLLWVLVLSIAAAGIVAAVIFAVIFRKKKG